MTEPPARISDHPAFRTIRRGVPILLVLALLLIVWQGLQTTEEDAPVPPAVAETGTDLPVSAEGEFVPQDPIRIGDGEGWEPRGEGRPPILPPEPDLRPTSVGGLPTPYAEDGDDPEEAYGVGSPPVLRPRGVIEWEPGRMQRDETGGRITVPPSIVWIGTPERWVKGITAARKGDVPEAFDFEAPRHTREIGAYQIDLYEVTNAQYVWYLRQSARIDFVVDRRIGGTLEEITRQIVVRDIPRNLDWEQVTRQLYETNRAALHAASPGLVVVDPTTEVVQPEATFQQFRNNRVKSGTLLTFFIRPPPGNWLLDEPPLGEEEDPVRFISFEEAQAFAHWAGKHLPTEFEWEYAARGAKGLAYPWGGRSQGFEERVNGGTPLAPGERPVTVPFNSLPAGASWIGCFHMLGNVAEWTSSYLEPYPNSSATHPEEGVAIIVRGGSAADEDALRVRPAFRGWRAPFTDPETGGVTDFTPFPDRRLPWVGFRCAVYAEPARSRLPEMQHQLQFGGSVDGRALAIERYSGAEAKELLDPGTPVEAGLFVPRRAFAVTTCALGRIAVPDASRRRFTIDGNHTIRSNGDLFTEDGSGDPVLFGMIQCDFPITRLHQTKDGGAGTPESLFPRQAPPGHYVVGLLHEHLALMTPDLSRVFYVTPNVATSANVNILKNKAPTDGSSPVATEQRVDPTGGRVWVEMRVPLGGGADPGHVVLVRFRYTTPRNAMAAVTIPWREYIAR